MWRSAYYGHSRSPWLASACGGASARPSMAPGSSLRHRIALGSTPSRAAETDDLQHSRATRCHCRRPAPPGGSLAQALGAIPGAAAAAQRAFRCDRSRPRSRRDADGRCRSATLPLVSASRGVRQQPGADGRGTGFHGAHCGRPPNPRSLRGRRRNRGPSVSALRLRWAVAPAYERSVALVRRFIADRVADLADAVALLGGGRDLGDV